MFIAGINAFMEHSLYAVAYSEPSRNPRHAPGKWVLPVLFTDEDTMQVKATQQGHTVRTIPDPTMPEYGSLQ